MAALRPAAFLRTALVLLAMTSSVRAATLVYEVKPAPTAASGGFADPSLAYADLPRAQAAPLVVFLSGTGGRPANTAVLAQVVAELGYRVLALAYDDVPAVAQVCPRDPDPGCSEAFRRMRVDGDGPFTTVHNAPAEAVVPRLVYALQALAAAHPDQGWDQYLDGGTPRWDRLVVSGLSQGAGMAAYIAKRHAVARVVLFSSPWDTAGRTRQPAPWLSDPSATPMDRWYAEYHRREQTVDLLRQAYAALQIPPDHILVFDHDLPPRAVVHSENPFHGMTIHDVSYAPQWRRMFGTP